MRHDRLYEANLPVKQYIEYCKYYWRPAQFIFPRDGLYGFASVQPVISAFREHGHCICESKI